jgi:hypothetical protein
MMPTATMMDPNHKPKRGIAGTTKYCNLFIWLIVLYDVTETDNELLMKHVVYLLIGIEQKTRM